MCVVLTCIRTDRTIHMLSGPALGGSSCSAEQGPRLFFCESLAFQYQLAEASTMIKSYTHVGVTCHISERCTLETCQANNCATLLHFLLIKENENCWKARLISSISFSIGSMMDLCTSFSSTSAQPGDNQIPRYLLQPHLCSELQTIPACQRLHSEGI
jgi:hypothetical protein